MMAALLIDSPLAERIRSIAEQEHRPVEAVLEAMVAQYNPSLMVKEIYARLENERDRGIALPPGDDADDFLSEDEETALIQRAGSGDKSGAQMVIDERKQGW
jgi:hypothetical protein